MLWCLEAEHERDKCKEALAFVKEYAVFPLGVMHDCRPGSPWDVVNAALNGPNRDQGKGVLS